MKRECKKPNKQNIGFILLSSFKELTTCTLEGPVTLFGGQNADHNTGVLCGKMCEGFAL